MLNVQNKRCQLHHNLFCDIVKNTATLRKRQFFPQLTVYYYFYNLLRNLNMASRLLLYICGVTLIICISFLFWGNPDEEIIYIPWTTEAERSLSVGVTISQFSVVLLSTTTPQSRESSEVEENNGNQNQNQTQELRLELESMLNYPVNDAIVESESSGVFLLNTAIRRNSSSGAQKGCANRMPHLDEILFSNDYWQVMRVASAKMYLYNAIADSRLQEGKIRVVGVADELYTLKGNYSHWCHLWGSNGSLIDTVDATVEPIWKFGNGGNYHPYLISCNLPQQSQFDIEHEWPDSVSIITGDDKCQSATNQLKVVKKFEKVGDFGVCFKWLDFADVDMSRRIVEMVELLRLLGVSGIHFPYMAAHPNIDKVLEYYKKEENQFVHTKPFSLPGTQPNHPFLRHLYLRRQNNAKIKQELVPYIDCFLENMYRYKYIAIIDIDEVILPTIARNYPSLFSELETPNVTTSFCFEMKLFVDKMKWPNGTLVADVENVHPEITDDPNLPYVTKKLYYDKACLCNSNRRRNVKCFHNTESVLLVHNHSPFKCLEGKTGCAIRKSMDIAYTHHHKDIYTYCTPKESDPPELLLDPFGYDENIKRFETKIITRRDSVLKELALQ